MDIWTTNIMDHYRHPRNWGQINLADFRADGANASCGDLISVSLKLDNEVIRSIKFTGQGCTISQAAMSILSDSLKDRTIQEVMSLDLDFIEKKLGLKISLRRQNCALLGLRTVQKALKEKSAS